MSLECKRGDLYLVNWNPGRGSEQTGKRPALIIQNDVGNKYSPTTIVAACSAARAKPYPFVVGITAKESGLDRDSSINLAQIMTIDKTRLEMKLGELSHKKMAAIDMAIRNSLGITNMDKEHLAELFGSAVLDVSSYDIEKMREDDL